MIDRFYTQLTDGNPTISNIASILVFVSGIVLVVTAFGHALAGWPPLHASLIRTGIDPGIVRALWAGWHFGSAAMLAFGVIVIVTVVRARHRHVFSTAPLFIIAVACIGFGVVAWLLVGFSSQFLGFIILGGLLGLGTQLRKHS
jgi:hypothetical protein